VEEGVGGGWRGVGELSLLPVLAECGAVKI